MASTRPLHAHYVQNKSLEISAKITCKLLQAPNLHIQVFLQPTRLLKVPKSIAKLEKRKVARLPNCSSCSCWVLFFFFSEASSNFAQAIAVVLAPKKRTFQREGPRQHSIFIIRKRNSKAIHSALVLQLVAILIILYTCSSHMCTVYHMTCTWQQLLSTSLDHFTREC